MGLKAIGFFVAAVLLAVAQVGVFDRIDLGGWATPFVEPFFILMLPFSISRASLLFIALVFGLVLDSMTNTPGLHAAALVLIAWLRPHVLSFLAPTAGYEETDEPRIGYLGFRWYLAYAGILITVYGAALLLLETFSFALFGFTLVRIAGSTAVSLFLILLLEYFFTPQRARL